jgi:proteasome component ECM29
MNSFNNIDNSLPSQIESLNVSLLNAFGQTTNYGGSAMQETETQALQRRVESEGNSETNVQETQVGGAAGISEAALGAYREMASAALSLGRVDVLYSLMILSTNHPIWLMSTMRDRYSAKALLGEAEGSSEEIRVSLRPHLGKLIPKLLRACNDPNKQTREQMNNLWLAITGGGGESRSTVTQYLLPTIDILIQDAGSKLWRARAGACGALADVIVGRSWQDLGGGEIEIDDEGYATKATASIRLLRLWRITVRA